MSLRDLQHDDLALASSVALSAIVVIVGEICVSPWFKALKIFTVFISLSMALYRLKVSRPFYKDIPASVMAKSGQYFESLVPKVEHGRGKYASATCLTPNTAGGYSKCFADASVLPNGDVLLRATQAYDFRLEVRR